MMPFSQTCTPGALCVDPYSVSTTSAPYTVSLAPSPKFSTSTATENSKASDNLTPHTQTKTSNSSKHLPLLNFSALAAPCALSTELCTARRKVEAYSTALSKINSYLYVGGIAAAKDAQALANANITHIINLTAGRIPNYHQHDPNYSFKYIQLAIRDDSAQCIDFIFQPLLHFIKQARSNNSACLIHCCQGVSRSVTAAAAFLIMDQAMGAQEALKEIVSKRPIAAPNATFLQALLRLEQKTKYGLKRPRVKIIASPKSTKKSASCSNFSNQNHFVALHEQQDPLYLAIDVDAYHPSLLQSHQVYIMERERWNGVVVWRGANTSNKQWEEAILIAKRMTDQMNIDRKRSLSSTTNIMQANKDLQIIVQDEKIEIEREMLQAMKPT